MTMTLFASFLRRLPLALVLIAICAATVESSTNRERRHVGTEESSHPPSKTRTSDNRNYRLSTSTNQITAIPERKVSHHLIGGHLKIDTRRQGTESPWDDGILMSAAGNGREGKSTRGDDEDEKKTLSQQVKEGKYGLIQDEIYGNRPKRPGIISYLGNPEVPKDTIDNLGGLDKEEIWLAENHVLVLRGGKFPEHEDGQQQSNGDGAPKWPPIDDYNAPRRQVKIPTRPKVPPPFPVQLTEGGPIHIIGPNGTTEITNDTFDYGADPFYTKRLLPEENPFFPINSNGTALTPDFGFPGNFSVEEKSSRTDNEQQKRVKPNVQPPSGFPPFYHSIPPGAVFVPPPGNQSDYDDEDQSIYYPPPYSFYYPQDNATAVPPGPLVPGIILPPPPDFFSALDNEKTTTTRRYTKQPSTTTTPSPRTRPTYLPPRKLTTKQYKGSSVVPTTVTKLTSPPIIAKISGRITIKNATGTFTTKPRTVSVAEITTATPGKPNTLENTEIYTISSIIGNQVSESTMQQKDWSAPVTSKTSPVLSYYPSTTQSSLERPVEVSPASIKSIITTSQPGRSSNHASYYFYEESSDEKSSAKPNPSAIYYKTTTESPYYNVDTRSGQAGQKKHHYAVETISPIGTSKDYDARIIDNIVKNSQIFHYTDPQVTSSKFDGNSPRSQSQRMLADESPVYYQPASARPNHPLQTYYTTPKPQTYYRQNTKPKPIYQYSFQVADYSKRGGNPRQYHREQQKQQDVLYNEYQDVKSGNQQYDYEDIDSRTQQQLPQKSISYKTQQHPIYPTSPAYSIVNTTPNPQHAYFTQQDEKLLDDVTKEYFTIFGKKLTDTAISSTTPIYGKSSSITEKPDHNINGYISNVYKTGRPATYKPPNVKVHYGDQSQRPYSLKDDTLVNYRRPLPPINPDSEFIEIIDAKHRQQQSPPPDYKPQTRNYRLQNQGVQQHRPVSRYRPQATVQPTNRHTSNFVSLTESREELEDVQRPVSLLDDIEVNFRDPRPPINPDAEFIDSVPVHANPPDKSNAYFAYRLPGDVGHFYFLTPQAITQRQDQNGGYVYPKPREPRLLRRRRRPDNV